MQNIRYVVPKPLEVTSTSRTFCDPRDRSDVTEKQEFVAENGRESMTSPQQSPRHIHGCPCPRAAVTEGMTQLVELDHRTDTARKIHRET